MNGSTVSIEYSDAQPPKEGVPSVLNGCYTLDGALCVVLANHTEDEQTVRSQLDPEAYGLPAETGVGYVDPPRGLDALAEERDAR